MSWLKRMLGAPAQAPEAVTRPAEKGGDSDPAARYEHAAALIEREDYEAALQELELLRELAPELPQVHFSLGYVLRHMGWIPEAIAAYRQVLALRPNHADSHSNLLLTLNYSAEHSAAEVFEEHRRYGERHVQPCVAPAPNRSAARKLRVGYLSPDFYSHVVSCFMLPVLAQHDRQKFETFCFHTGLVKDAATGHMRALAGHWADCAGQPDAQVAERIRADRIDILVELAGHTAHQRQGVLALRPAPVQVSYLGYPNTTGLRAVDWRISDARADPPGESDRLHVERLARLPRSFLCYRPGPEIHAVPPLPAARAGHVTFGCFNNFQKLSGPFFEAAAMLLAVVPDSKLIVKAKPLQFASVQARLRDRFARAGADPTRLILRGWEKSVEDHLAAYAEVDIALDSFPYNGTTTTCEAFWMGAPVVTLAGDRHASRVGASLLHSMGLGELVARDAADYVRIAAALAADRVRLARLRDGMRERLKRSPLMDEEGFVRELEGAYADMWAARLAQPARAPDSAGVRSLLARAKELRAGGALEEAKQACASILDLRPDDCEALDLYWKLCNETAAHGAAIERIGAALAAKRGVAHFHYMLGCSFEDLERMEEAMAAYREALALEPGLAKAANNLGALLEMSGHMEKAAAQYQAAARDDPKLPQALVNLGNLHKRRGDPAGAMAWLRKAIDLDPGNPDLRYSLAGACILTWELDEAAQSCRAALAIDPKHERAHFGLGNVLQLLGRADEAELCFREALRIKPDFVEAHSRLLLCLHYRKGDEPALLAEEHREWDLRHCQAVPRLQALRGQEDAAAAPRKLRIGYVSPNFHRHSVAFFLEALFAAHDRGAFSIHGYSSVAHPDEVTERLRSLFDGWRDVSEMDEEQIARRIRADRIDILVDLAGHTDGGRLRVFARKPAPVQASWLGYPNTTALAAMDWRLTDARADPPGESDSHHSEKLLRLEHGFLCYAPPEQSPDVSEPPCVRAGHFSFGSFNDLAKITPEMVALWAQLLARLPGSRMLIKAHGIASESAQRALYEGFAAHGVEAARLTLLGAEPNLQHHLGHYGEVDIALDTFPYHGTTATCEALWMGVPVVTLEGRTHVARVGLSLLHQVGLVDLVARDREAYIAKAVELAGDERRLRELRAGLRGRMRASALTDGAGFARSLEEAFRAMWAKHLKNLDGTAINGA